MPTSSIKTPEWREPQQGENAGIGAWNRPNSPYDNFMESEGIPIHRGIGVHRVQDLPLRDWKRTAGKERLSSCTARRVYGVAMWSKFPALAPSFPNITCMKKSILS